MRAFVAPITALLLSLSGPVLAQAGSKISISAPWVRATVPQQKATGAFMQLAAPQGARLVEVRSPVAGRVEIHEMAMEGDVMKMRPLDGLDLPAGKTVELKPGAHHLMMLELKAQVKAGDSVPLTLVFETRDGKRESVELKAGARGLGSSDAAHGQHKH